MDMDLILVFALSSSVIDEAQPATKISEARMRRFTSSPFPVDRGRVRAGEVTTGNRICLVNMSSELILFVRTFGEREGWRAIRLSAEISPSRPSVMSGGSAGFPEGISYPLKELKKQGVK